MRLLGKLTKYVTGALLAFLIAMLAAGCAESDDFEFLKDERQMMRQGQYGSGMTDEERQKLQESYAQIQSAEATPTSGGAAP